ncbi:MAG: FHA domain-containing protein [Planctomycetes bacterium]|nr:FHA domain-containing protein [Planctomycetota bacterium]
MSSGFLVSEVMRTVESRGREGLKELAPGPFLVEIPTQDPQGMNRLSKTPEGGATTSVKTMEFDEELLLDLKRSRGSAEARVYALSAGATLGRSSSCNVSLSGEESVSGEHVRFERDGDAWRVKDLGSTNGTFVNRERVEPGASAELPGLIPVQFGGRRFAFADTDDLVALLSPIQTIQALEIKQLYAELETLGSRRFLLRHATPYLLVSYARGESDAPASKPSLAFPLIEQPEIKIGRTSKADITLRKDAISKWHAKLTRDGERWLLADLGSSNGTEINGRVLEKTDDPVRLNNWDAINFANAAWCLFLSPRSLLENLTENA